MPKFGINLPNLIYKASVGVIIDFSNAQAEYGYVLTNYAETLLGPADTVNFAPNSATGRVNVAGAANTFTTTLTTVQTGTIITTGGEVTVWVGGFTEPRSSRECLSRQRGGFRECLPRPAPWCGRAYRAGSRRSPPRKRGACREKSESS